MKKIILIITIVLLTLTSTGFAQWDPKMDEACESYAMTIPMIAFTSIKKGADVDSVIKILYNDNVPISVNVMMMNTAHAVDSFIKHNPNAKSLTIKFIIQEKEFCNEIGGNK